MSVRGEKYYEPLECECCGRKLMSLRDIESVRRCRVCGQQVCYECFEKTGLVWAVCPDCLKEPKETVELLLAKIDELERQFLRKHVYENKM